MLRTMWIFMPSLIEDQFFFFHVKTDRQFYFEKNRLQPAPTLLCHRPPPKNMDIQIITILAQFMDPRPLILWISLVS